MLGNITIGPGRFGPSLTSSMDTGLLSVAVHRGDLDRRDGGLPVLCVIGVQNHPCQRMQSVVVAQMERLQSIDKGDEVTAPP